MCLAEWDSTDHILRFCPWTIQVMDSLQLPRATVDRKMDYRKWLIESFMKGDDISTNTLAVTIRQSFQEISCFITGYLNDLDSLSFENTHFSNQQKGVWKTLK